METAPFTVTHVTVPSSKPYEEVIQAFESVLGEGDSRSFAEMVRATETWDEFVREIEQRIGESGFVIFAQIDHGAWMSQVPHNMKGKLYVIGNPPHRRADARTRAGGRTLRASEDLRPRR